MKKLVPYKLLIVAGNSFLSEYAQSYNNDVFVVPTVVDLERYRPKSTYQTQNDDWSNRDGAFLCTRPFEEHRPYPVNRSDSILELRLVDRAPHG